MPYRAIITASLQSAALFIAGFIIPFLGQITTLFVPVPLVVVTVLHGRQSGLFATLISAVLIALIGSWQTAIILFFLSSGLMAFGLSYGMMRNLRAEASVILGTILQIILLVTMLAPVAVKSDKGLFILIEGYLTKSLADIKELYTSLGLTDIVSMTESLSATFIFYIARLVPGFVLATTLAQAASCYGIARTIILKRNPNIPLASQPTLALWHAPDLWVWGLIIALGLLALANTTQKLIGMNMLLVFLLIYVTQGAAVVDFFLRKAKIPPLGRSLLLMLTIALPTVVAVIALGVVDIWADFRKIRQMKNTRSQV